jgi:site-specific DNA-methyltransferase (adenine-specific)
MSTINLYHQDCMEAMREMPDKAFELAIVDPPYGIGDCVSSKSSHIHKVMTWNDSIPSQQYFDELCRVSKNQIIWGANYYQGIRLPVGRIIHDKLNGDCQSSSLSDADIASQSFNKLIKIWPYRWRGNVQGNSINWKNTGIDSKIHPTQKPVALYKWLLKNYAKPGDKILDTHGGSMSIAIACDIMGFDLDLYEIDEDYFKAGKERFERHKRQQVFDFQEAL